MSAYEYNADVPAIRAANPEHPWVCPWCGDRTWFISSGDDRTDRGRVEMYCDNPDCDSRETVVLIVRGHTSDYSADASDNADVRALADTDAAPSRHVAGSGTDAAAEWLTGYLLDHGGEASADDVVSAAQAQGISRTKLQRARGRAGITSHRSLTFPAHTVWRLTRPTG